jgi:SsrA-binding protein
MTEEKAIKVIATNRRAWHDYHVLEKHEAGIALCGTEVKSLRAGKASLVDSYASFNRGEAFVHNLLISPYEKANRFNHEERRPRKLLMHKQEIGRLAGQVSQKGFTLVPLRLYFKGSHVKVELGVVRGKKEYDKRHDLKERETRREIDRVMKERGAK